MEAKENDYIKFWIENEIIYGVYKVGVIIDLQAAIEIIALRKSLSNGKSYNFLCYFYNAKQFTEEAKSYMASKEACEEMKKVALIVNSSFTKQAGNLFILFFKPQVPIKLFTNEFDAIEWLKKKTKKLSKATKKIQK